jgi:hypothetical protein
VRCLECSTAEGSSETRSIRAASSLTATIQTRRSRRRERFEREARRGARVAYVSTRRFLAADAVKNLPRSRNSRRWQGGESALLHADAPLNLSLPGVKTHVPGPPTLKQSDAIRKMREKDDVSPGCCSARRECAFAAGSGQRSPIAIACRAHACLITRAGCAIARERRARKFCTASCASSTIR